MADEQGTAEVTWTDKGMSNFDRSVDPGLADDLKAGMRAQHSAWNFCGEVRWDAERELFTETVRRYRAEVGQFTAPTLEELMAEVNDQYGWD